MRAAFAIPLLLLAACGSRAPVDTTPVADGRYALRVVRDSRVGEAFRVEATGNRSERTRITAGEAVLDEADASVTFTLVARMRVDAVTRVGLASRETWTIESFTEDGAALLAPGTVVRVDRTAGVEHVLTVDGGPLRGEAGRALALALEPPALVGADEFLAPSPLAVGETRVWPADDIADALARDEAIVLSPDQVAGHLALARLEEIGGVSCAVLVARADVADVPLVELPPGTHITRSAARLDVTTHLPTDPRVPWLRDRAAFVLDLEAELQLEDGAAILTFHYATEREARRTPLP